MSTVRRLVTELAIDNPIKGERTQIMKRKASTDEVLLRPVQRVIPNDPAAPHIITIIAASRRELEGRFFFIGNTLIFEEQTVYA